MCTAATALASPCSAKALENGQFYHAYPLDRHFYVQCDESGFPHIRPCPPSLVWSDAEVTCVRKSETMSSADENSNSMNKPWDSAQQQQQQQQDDDSMPQNTMNGWQQSDAQNPWSMVMGSGMDNMQPWMVSYRHTRRELTSAG